MVFLERWRSAVSEVASQCLSEAVEKLDLTVEQSVMDQLDQYCRILWDWNTRINLTRHTDYDLFARRDLLDSIQLAEQLAPDEDVLDVGTGGGVPGLLLAILRPDLSVSVCDSVAKKSRVVEDMVKRLKLPVVVHATRVQNVIEDLRFHSLVTRAVGSLSRLLTWVQDNWLNFDRLLAIKGPRWVEERGQARQQGLLAGLELRKLAAYPMPGTESESTILQIRKARADSSSSEPTN